MARAFNNRDLDTKESDHSVDLRATAGNSREQTLPRLRTLLQACRGFMLEDGASSEERLHLTLEVPRRNVFDLYSGLLAAELDLSRDSHLRLTGLCTLRRYHPLRNGNITLLLELTFPDETGLGHLPDGSWLAAGLA